MQTVNTIEGSIITASSTIATPWKNGGGISRQIFISPRKKNGSLENFNWRLSMAETESSGPFSIFKGFDRWIISCSQADILLRHDKNPAWTTLKQHEPYFFSGDVLTNCWFPQKLCDFNFIVDRSVSKSWVKVAHNDTALRFLLDCHKHFLWFHILHGEVTLNNCKLLQSDTFVFHKNHGALSLNLDSAKLSKNCTMAFGWLN